MLLLVDAADLNNEAVKNTFDKKVIKTTAWNKSNSKIEPEVIHLLEIILEALFKKAGFSNVNMDWQLIQ